MKYVTKSKMGGTIQALNYVIEWAALVGCVDAQSQNLWVVESNAHVGCMDVQSQNP